MRIEIRIRIQIRVQAILGWIQIRIQTFKSLIRIRIQEKIGGLVMSDSNPDFYVQSCWIRTRIQYN